MNDRSTITYLLICQPRLQSFVQTKEKLVHQFIHIVCINIHINSLSRINTFDSVSDAYKQSSTQKNLHAWLVKVFYDVKDENMVRSHINFKSRYYKQQIPGRPSSARVKIETINFLNESELTNSRDYLELQKFVE